VWERNIFNPGQCKTLNLNWLCTHAGNGLHRGHSLLAHRPTGKERTKRIVEGVKRLRHIVEEGPCQLEFEVEGAGREVAGGRGRVVAGRWSVNTRTVSCRRQSGRAGRARRAVKVVPRL
jgi:hypothetical protein